MLHARNVLVSCVTYDKVTTSTVARWLKLVWNLSGIDTVKFKAHSHRAASASAAFSRGCSLKSIFDTADWSSEKNFRVLFKTLCVKRKVSYMNAVFKKWSHFQRRDPDAVTIWFMVFNLMADIDSYIVVYFKIVLLPFKMHSIHGKPKALREIMTPQPSFSAGWRALLK